MTSLPESQIYQSKIIKSQIENTLRAEKQVEKTYGTNSTRPSRWEKLGSPNHCWQTKHNRLDSPRHVFRSKIRTVRSKWTNFQENISETLSSSNRSFIRHSQGSKNRFSASSNSMEPLESFSVSTYTVLIIQHVSYRMHPLKFK